jgi:hypothetical protein
MNNQIVKIKVSKTVWSQTENAWYILSIQLEINPDLWSIGFWYPKRICFYDDGIITAPKWLYDRMFGHLENKPKLIGSEKCDHCKGMGRKYAGLQLGHMSCPKCNL